MVQYQCPFCGQQFSTQSPVPTAHCPACGREFTTAAGPQAQASGQPQQPQQPQQPPFGQQQYGPQQYAYGPVPQGPGVFDEGPSGKSRGVAGLLAILLGGLGAHYFYLGKVGGAFICILLTIITCGLWSVLTLIQGIVMFTMNQNDFEQKYVLSQSTFPLF